jgi:hypothetical protein
MNYQSEQQGLRRIFPGMPKGPRGGVVALQRVGRGLLGSWCIVSPFVLIFGYSQFAAGESEAGPTLVFVAILSLVFYTGLIWKWHNQGFAFLKAVALDTFLLIVFSATISSIFGIISAFGGPGLHKIGGITLGFTYVVFWILEARRKQKMAHAA